MKKDTRELRSLDLEQLRHVVGGGFRPGNPGIVESQDAGGGFKPGTPLVTPADPIGPS